jgi:hypothetical protein
MRILALTLGATVAACSQSPEEKAFDTPSADEIPAPQGMPTGSAASGMPFNVPSDMNARYSLLSVTKGKGGNIVATTRREGSSGTSFARREIDCAAQTYRYIGEGDTLLEANQPVPNPGEMATLVDGSISDVTVKFACAHQ